MKELGKFVQSYQVEIYEQSRNEANMKTAEDHVC